MPTWQSSDIQANGIRLHLTRTGGAKPPLVLAHGATSDGLRWTPTAQALAPLYDVIMVDARGHGMSEASEHGYGLANQARDLAGVITALGLSRPILLGHSLGAMTTLALAGLYPDVPQAILLEDPPPWWLDRPERAELIESARAQMRAQIEGLKRQTRDENIADQRAASPNWPEVEVGRWVDAKLRVNLNALNFGPEPNFDWPAQYARITCPALLITADTSLGAIVTPDAAAGLQALVPQLRIAHIPGAGHSIHRDQPVLFMEAVRAFLATLPDTAPI